MRKTAKRRGLTADKRLAQLAKTYHHHACVQCGHIYEDRCVTPETDAQCQDCWGHGRPRWVTDRDPHACCVNTAPLLDQESLLRYRCAGQAGWWICLTCQRVRPVR
jgi:hypothetical protein